MNYHAYFQQFYPIDDALIDLLLAKSITKHYKKGEIITSEGQIQRDLLLVEEGVQMSYFNNDGKLHVVAFTYSPSVSGIPESFLLQKPSQYYLQALTNTTVKSIDYHYLNELFDQHQILERLFRKMTESMFIGLTNRHIELHSLNIAQRFRAFAQRSPHLFQLVPHKYIANYLHIDPSNFSKLFNSIKI